MADEGVGTVEITAIGRVLVRPRPTPRRGRLRHDRLDLGGEMDTAADRTGR